MITVSEGALAVCRDRAVIVKSIAGTKIIVKTDNGEKTVKAKELAVIHPGPAAVVPQPAEAELSCEEAAELIGSETLDFAGLACKCLNRLIISIR